ncbi:MAG: hypothetical protein PH343_00365 [Nitrospira sp.]|nr:hypothetical protein [Nitrospira sp.]
MELIEETLKLSPFYFTLSQQEKNDLVEKLLAGPCSVEEDKAEEGPSNS